MKLFGQDRRDREIADFLFEITLHGTILAIVLLLLGCSTASRMPNEAERDFSDSQYSFLFNKEDPGPPETAPEPEPIVEVQEEEPEVEPEPSELDKQDAQFFMESLETRHMEYQEISYLCMTTADCPGDSFCAGGSRGVGKEKTGRYYGKCICKEPYGCYGSQTFKHK